MRHRPLASIGILALLQPLLLYGQGAAIVMDGTFDDWTPGLTTFVDNNTPAAGLDLLRVQVTNDEHHLYLKLDVGTEIDLQDDLVPHGICLFIDGDNDASTGSAPQSPYGAEVRVRFDNRAVTEYFGTSGTVSWTSLDLVTLPTVTSTSFEIAIARNARPDGVNDLFTSPTIKLLFTELDNNDRMPNTGAPAFTYTFDDAFTAPITPVPVLRQQASDVRVLAWNVLGDGLIDPALQGAYQRILTALEPDVIGFSECVNSTAADVKGRLDNWLPLGGAGWQVAKDDYDLVIASRWPITQSWTSLSRQFPAVIDLPESYSSDLLFTASHLNCCTADATRQAQCDAYVQFVQDAMAPGGSVTVAPGTPMVYAGDLNAVGWAQQLSTLLTGDIVNNATFGPDGPMDWDGTGLARAACRQTDAHMAYTWRSETSAYPSGLLDHLFYTDGVADLTSSFTLRTEVMPSATLAALGLQASDASTASDHFPLVADLAIPLAGVNVRPRALLDGPFVAGTGLMHDSLRTRGLIPLAEPYTALGYTLPGTDVGATIDPAVLLTSGPDAVVDWVLLELRDLNTGTVGARVALIQRDGDVVGLDGSAAVHFDLPAGDHHVVLRHRNHLGVMTADALPLGPVATQIDLTDPGTATFGIDALKGTAPKRLWSGNARADGSLRYTGASNDRDPILVRVGGSVPTGFINGYLQEDVNMDGTVKYTGAANDRDALLLNIGGTVPTSSRAEQLP